jgi:hypothetical protein
MRWYSEIWFITHPGEKIVELYDHLVWSFYNMFQNVLKMYKF